MPRSPEDARLDEMARYLRVLMRQVEGPEGGPPPPRPRTSSELGLQH
jgi:hypothetical protein